MWLAPPIFESARKNAFVYEKLAEQVLSYSGWHWVNKNPIQYLVPPSIEQLQKSKPADTYFNGQWDIPDFKELAGVINNQIRNSLLIEISGAVFS